MAQIDTDSMVAFVRAIGDCIDKHYNPSYPNGVSLSLIRSGLPPGRSTRGGQMDNNPVTISPDRTQVRIHYPNGSCDDVIVPSDRAGAIGHMLRADPDKYFASALDTARVRYEARYKQRRTAWDVIGEDESL